METSIKNRKLYAAALGVLGVLLVAVLAIGLTPSQSFAGSIRTSGGAKSYNLSFDKTCYKYDITGDKKADAIRVTTNKKGSAGKFTKLTVTVNGKKVFSKSGLVSYTSQDRVVLLKLKNKKTYLYLQCFSFNGKKDLSVLLQYKGKKLVDALPTSSLLGKKFFKNRNYTVVVDSAKGNTLAVQLYNAKSYAFGDTFISAQYQYKKGKFVTPATVKYDSYDCALAKTVAVYKDKACKKKIGTVAKGQAVRFSEIYSKGNHCAAKMKYGKKTAWVKCGKATGKLTTDLVYDEPEEEDDEEAVDPE